QLEEQRRAAESGPAETAGLTTQLRQLLDSVVTGYTMSLQRLDRALEQQGLQPIPCVGQRFDPETMEVAEVVDRAGRTPSEVVEEIRPGSLWRGRLFRLAQVCVAREPVATRTG